MNCKDIERLILERGDRRLEAAARKKVDEHLVGCEKCRRYESGLAEIRAGLKDLEWDSLPEPLALRTKRMALDILGGNQARKQRDFNGVSVPSPILAALTALTLLTGIWITAALSGLELGQTFKDLPFRAQAALLLICQNSLVLVCTPLILRGMRSTPIGNRGSGP